MDIQYLGEHLLPGLAGRIGIYLSLAAAILAAFSYFKGSGASDRRRFLWRQRGRWAFIAHLGLVLVVSTLFMYIIMNRFYEYRYVWAHAENDLSLGFMIAAFWAGQEGSLLFWILCQAVFGIILLRHAGQWESPVMTVVSLSQVFMVSMILGVSFGGFTIGMDPFLLLRDSNLAEGNDFFRDPTYLSFITDGNGLNPLLRNFWMLSHPPFTFIGYAAVLVPFAFAIAGLWQQRLKEWIKPALPWTIAGVLFLGIGIFLGGVWAYESLTFGGFWAWDPIENASLVPWLVLVASLHLMLICYKRNNSCLISIVFVLLSFILVVYATYLTRSGVLAETSVHSFGNDGMGRQIMIYIGSMVIVGAALIIRRIGLFRGNQTDNMFTREFWLYIASLIMVLSAFQIIFSTSIPLINKVFGAGLAPPTDVVTYYNTWQLPFAVVIAFLMGISQFIHWGRNQWPSFVRSVSVSLLLALVFTILIRLASIADAPGHVFMLFSALFALFSSLDLLLRLKNRIPSYGSVITHLGVAMFLLAVLLTFGGKTIISKNTSGFHLGAQFPDNENLLLIRGEVLPMGEYHVVYSGKEFDGTRLKYSIDFLKTNKDGEYYRVFGATPSILINEKMGNVYEPFARIYPLRDVFTYITFADVDRDLSPQSAVHPRHFTMALHDSIQSGGNLIVLESITTSQMAGDAIDPENIILNAGFRVRTPDDGDYQVEAAMRIESGRIFYEDATVAQADLRLRFRQVSEEAFTIHVDVYHENPEFIVIKTVLFPYINLLWISGFVILAGLIVSLVSRWKKRYEITSKTE